MISLFDQPWSRARELVATGAPVFATVNPVEFHGPHLSLHNDRLVSRGLCRDLHRHLYPQLDSSALLLGADLEVGVEPAAGRGSRHTPYRVVRQLVVETCRALAELGAQRVILMTFHGAPMHAHALQAGVDQLARLGVPAVAPFNLLLEHMVDLNPEPFADALDEIEDPDERREMLATLDLDFHAGFFETSLALHYAPESVSAVHRELPDCPPYPYSRIFGGLAGLARRLGARQTATELAFIARAIGWTWLDPYPGYTGRPRHASAEAGRRFAAHIVPQMAAVVRAVLAGERPAPRPGMGWMPWVTLAGRMHPPPVPLSRMPF